MFKIVMQMSCKANQHPQGNRFLEGVLVLGGERHASVVLSVNLGLPEAWGKVSFGGDGKFEEVGWRVLGDAVGKLEELAQSHKE